MRTASLVWLLLVGALICIPAGAAPSWLASGIVTRVDGDTLYFLSRENSIYRIDARSARIASNVGQLSPAIASGDKVRVFGYVSKQGNIQAAQIRVLATIRAASAQGSGPRKEVKIVVEKQPGQVPEVAAAGADAAPACCDAKPWQGKGIVIDIDYVGKQIRLQTSDSNYTIDVDNAQMIRGTTRVRFGSLNLGDTIWVQGSLVAANVVDGRMIRVLRTVSEAQNAVPQLPLTIVGVIQQIDYPSRTFKMAGPNTTVVVSVDDHTDIFFQMNKKQFNDLKAGTKISMNGTGSLATGYTAQHIQIVGGP